MAPIISPCDGLPSLIDQLDEGQSGVLLNGVLPLLSVEDTWQLIWPRVAEVHTIHSVRH